MTDGIVGITDADLWPTGRPAPIQWHYTPAPDPPARVEVWTRSVGNDGRSFGPWTKLAVVDADPSGVLSVPLPPGHWQVKARVAGDG